MVNARTERDKRALGGFHETFDRRGQVLHVTDEPIRLEFRNGNVGVAEFDPDDRDAGPPRHANIRASSFWVTARPSTSSPRSISFRAPAPIMLRAACIGTGGTPSRSSTKLSAAIRSGAVSTSVPSRSKTTMRGELMGGLAIGPR